MSFTLFNDGRCQASGCEQSAKQFGFCDRHYRAEVGRRWHALRIEGRTTQPLPCFDSERWMEYEVHWADTTLKPVNACTDCTPDHQRAMMMAGRCVHPETVFVRRGGAVEGFNADNLDKYLVACAGGLGKVVNAPSAEERQRILEGRL